MLIGSIDCTFNYMPFPPNIARLGSLVLGATKRLGLLKKGHYLLPAIRLMSSIGLNCVQITYYGPGQFNADPKDIRAICSDMGIKISSVGFFLGSTKIKDAVDFASDIGTDIICLNTCTSYYKSMDTLLKDLASASDYASENGIVAAVENSPFGLIKTDDDLLSLVKNMSRLRVNLDIGNLNLVSCNTVNAVNKLRNYIVHTHIKDTRLSGSRYVFTELGKGDVMIPEYLGLLRNIRYDGPLIIEYEGRGNPLLAIKKGKDYLESELKKLE